MKKIYVIALLVSVNVAAFSQVKLPVPTNIQNAFDKETRSVSGAPGKNYWQNRADYDVAVNFDPQTRLLDGKETIIYQNKSPDTLKSLVFKLYPNLYKKGSQRLMSIQPEDISDGVMIKQLAVNDVVLPEEAYQISGTNMIVKITALLPGSAITVKVAFNYTLNKESHIRTGQVDTGAFFIAYYFPRIAVYDDVDGWNRNPYLGTQEFYNDFCDFKTSITVPNNYVVWATGDLKNGAEIFTDKYLQRIKQAETTDGYVNVIDSADIAEGSITKGAGSNTWIFDSKNVTDAVFALSNHYIWQSTSLAVDKSTGRRTRVDAVFNKDHKDYFHVLSDARKTVEAMSFSFPKWPYPYNHETVFDGLDQMEYPMMVNDNPVEDRAEASNSPITRYSIRCSLFTWASMKQNMAGWTKGGQPSANGSFHR